MLAASNEKVHFVQLSNREFYTGRIAKLYTQGAQRVQKARF